ncbi:DUF2274 domain-containing protein [Paremcibacter congregatus]|uniref:Transposase n=1 Tax=Paremcibacter congregatus TaxID=2043170 RepID=A0A2G4YWK4_9PROT|nr:DUF2274 domain-containing protein [Paremcibacter congregatus]PHZ86711.1 transposase [Paremcibacter congregatus]QDE27605.1 DUF2274 domain-containing protein [Paremcibacter congregatus]
MPLKLAKLPKRTPVKITCQLQADVHEMLSDYARIYESTYGMKEPIEELIPFIVAAFLEGDHAFKKARRELEVGESPATEFGR